MMDVLQRCVEQGEKLGADFVEARFEDLTLRTLSRIDNMWKDIQMKSRRGVAVSCYVKGVAGFSFTASTDSDSVQETVERAFKMARASLTAAKLKLPFERDSPISSEPAYRPTVKIHPRDRDLAFKTDLVNRAVETAQEHGKNVRNIRGAYGELYGQKMLTNSDGSEIDWDFLVTELRVRVTSKTASGDMVLGIEIHGGTYGLEEYQKEEFGPEALGRTAAENAAEQIDAKPCPGGVFRTLIENRLVGVLAHESFGHLSEADFVVTGASPLTDKVGQRLGTEHATIIDSGIVEIEKYGGLWVPFDDQGIPGGETVVLEKGVLKHYLHDRGTAARLNQRPTGNARAITFNFPPIVRMTNTYFAPGDLTEEEALELVGTGIYAIQSYGGQVEGDGSFVFKAVRGYWVENGEIKYPIREVSLSGNVLELLGHLEGATRDLQLSSGYFGGCGKGGQAPLPVGLGGPKLVVDGVTFGGKT
ncbi:MAG: TldD/PmbA family protein [Candidatus Thorarchaeota archaeon]